MRNVALSLLIGACTVGSPRMSYANDGEFPVGKSVPWETANPKPIAAPDGKHIETPNEERKRLGQPIVATFPALEYGETLETPNHLRERVAAAEEVATRR
jgi:hypothetical protein